ncbi:hypothetical protein QN363_20915, partial [Undibacterium sp. CCC2.1]|nr:hypothetical protein [Undibacterium sp. CCC2.1]
YYSEHLNDPSTVNFYDLLDVIGGNPQVKILHDACDDSIHYTFTTSAIQSSRFSSRLAFANNILGPSYNYEIPVIDTV